MDPVTFNWKDGVGDKNEHLGLIAQNVQQYFPQFVNTIYDDYLGVDYGALTVPLIGAVHEQQALITNLQDISLNASGNIMIAGQQDGSYLATLPSGAPVTADSAFDRSAIANLRAGLVDALALKVIGKPLTQVVQEIVQNVLSSSQVQVLSGEKLSAKLVQADTITAPTVTADTVTASTIQATTSSSLAIRLDPGLLSLMNNDSGTPTAVAQFDTAGNATFSGDLTARSARLQYLETVQLNTDRGLFGTATVSGTLYAKQLEAERITGLADLLSDNSRSTLEIATKAAALAGNSAGSQAAQQLLSTLLAPQDASPEAILAELNSLSGRQIELANTLRADTLILDSALDVRGLARIADARITNSLTVGNSLQFSGNSIEMNVASQSNPSLSDTLYIQPSGNGSIDLLAGLLKIESGRVVTINGDLYVNGSINTKAVLTSTLSINEPPAASPVPSLLGALLKTYDEHGNVVAAIDASGSAKVAELNTRGIVIAAPNGTQQTIGGAPTGNATAGKALLPAGQTEVVIPNAQVQANTLIYLTPLTNTQNQVLFVKNKADSQSFTVAMNAALPQDVEFNYWLIKVE